MLTITVCTHADRAERASMVSIRTDVILIFGFQETDIDGDKVCENLDDYADRMRLRIRCELAVWKDSCLNVLDDGSGDRLVTHRPRIHRGEERFPGMTITFALIRIVRKIAERSSSKLV